MSAHFKERVPRPNMSTQTLRLYPVAKKKKTREHTLSSLSEPLCGVVGKGATEAPSG